jgi:hypothetical protein
MAPGRYVIQATLVATATTKRTGFVVLPVFPFDPAKVEGLTDVSKLETIIGRIKNQSWIRSASLSESELRTLVTLYSELTVIGYEKVRGLLIQYDERDLVALDRLAALEFLPGVGGVFPRMHQGKDVPRTTTLPPGFSAADFSDGGNNWHLERINAVQAWDHIVGDPSIYIGMVDSWLKGAEIGQHREMIGRVESDEVGTAIDQPAKDHGFGVAGAMAARTSDAQGITGVNWRSKLVPRTGDTYAALTNLVELPQPPKAINISRALGGWIQDNFDPGSETERRARGQFALDSASDARVLADATKDVLFVFSAGNGIGNGVGNSNGVFGVDAKYANGAIHFDKYQNYQPSSNVLVVAAMRSDGVLAHYSNFGRSVDIAAPTHYGGITSADGYSTGLYGISGDFSGTSAAAPLVTGVASLVYSIFPAFTAAEVKDIIVTSAKENGAWVVERYTDTSWTTKELLDQNSADDMDLRIPVVNAEAAVRLAKRRAEEKIRVAVDFPDPFEASARVIVQPMDPGFAVDGVDYALDASVDGGLTWTARPGASVVGGNFGVPLDAVANHYRLTATVHLTSGSSGQRFTVNRVDTFGIARVGVMARDAVSGAPLPGVAVALETLRGVRITGMRVTDRDGRLNAYTYIDPPSYRVRGTLPGYVDAVSTPVAGGGGSIEVNLRLSPKAAAPTGSFAGVVTDLNGRPIVGATVRISGRAQTDGFFRSAVTNALGRYELLDVPYTGNDGLPVYGFDFEASAARYASRTVLSFMVTGAVVPLDILMVAGTPTPPPPPPPPPPTTGADLAFQGIFFEPTTVNAGGSTAISFRIVNNGAGAAATSKVAVRINTSDTSSAGANVVELDVPPLAASAGVDLSTTVPVAQSPGTYYLWVLADNRRTAGQPAAAEVNDIVRAPGALTVAAPPSGGPDLVSQSASLSATTVPPGGSAAVFFIAKNAGTSPAASSVTEIRISSSAASPAGSTLLASVNVPPIGAAAIDPRFVSFTAPSAPGAYRLWLVSDSTRSAGQFGTALENDASLVPGTLTVAEGAAGGPDLVAETISFEPAQVTAGGMTLVSFTITNTGATRSNESTAAVRISRLADGVTGPDLATVRVPVMYPGDKSRHVVGVNAPEAAGDYKVWVVADVRGMAGQTTSAAVSNDAAGGNGALTVTGRQVPPGATAEGAYSGILTGGPYPAFRLLELDGGEYWALYGFGGGDSFAVAGFLHGTSSSSSGNFISSDLRDFGFIPSVSGTATATFDASKGTIAGSVTTSRGSVSIAGGPIQDVPYEYNLQATMEQIAGPWGLQTSTGDMMIVAVPADGNFSTRTTAGCNLSGTIKPRPSGKNVYDVTIQFGAAPCLLPGQSMRGLAITVRQTNGFTQLTIVMINAARTIGFSAFGYN